MSENKSKVEVVLPGGGFLGMLAIAFIVLKLTNVLAWSWLWVLAPIWLPLAVFFGVLLVWLIFAIIFGVTVKKR